MIKEKAVVILSGGMDSTTLLYDVINQGYDVSVISFDYGQKHVKELDVARQTTQKLNLEHNVLNLDVLNKVAPSALTRDDWEIPEGHYADENMKQTVVANRNMVMLSIAGAYAMGVGAKKLFYGAHAGDHDIYPDCRKEFIDSFQNSQILANDNKNLRINAPFVDLDKSDIVKLGNDLNVPFENTWSCYKGKKNH